MTDSFHQAWIERHGHPPTADQREAFEDARYFYEEGAQPWRKIIEDALEPLGDMLYTLHHARKK